MNLRQLGYAEADISASFKHPTARSKLPSVVLHLPPPTLTIPFLLAPGMGTLNSPSLDHGGQVGSFSEEQVKLLAQAGTSFFTSWSKVAHMLGGSYSMVHVDA